MFKRRKDGQIIIASPVTMIGAKLSQPNPTGWPMLSRHAWRWGTCLSEADAGLAAAELFRVDVFRHQEIAVGKSRRAEGIEKQLTHVPRWQG